MMVADYAWGTSLPRLVRRRRCCLDELGDRRPSSCPGNGWMGWYDWHYKLLVWIIHFIVVPLEWALQALRWTNALPRHRLLHLGRVELVAASRHHRRTRLYRHRRLRPRQAGGRARQTHYPRHRC